MNIASDLARTSPLPSQSMDVAALVAQLRDQGIDLTLSDGRLRYNAPRGALDPAAMEPVLLRVAPVEAQLPAPPSALNVTVHPAGKV